MKKSTILFGLTIGVIFSAFFLWYIGSADQSASLPLRSASERTPGISGIVVPHHNIVEDRRAAMFQVLHDRLSGAMPSSIILISPNHYGRGRDIIQTTDQEWTTTDGTLTPDESLVNLLVQEGVARREPESFADEHGIKLIVGDIKRAFPDAKLVPLMMKEKTNSLAIEKLIATLNASCTSCLVVASVDFSHYQPAALAELHDRLSLRALQTKNIELLMNRAEVDAPAVLAFLASWARTRGTERFTLFDHTNSGVMLRNPDAESTSHLFGWYEEGKPEKPAQGVTFAFGGDMMFGRAVGSVYEKKKLTTLFDHFGNRVFWGVDAAIANLEGPISKKKVTYSVLPNNLSFLFSPKTIDVLQFLKLNGVSLANNHTLNNAAEGLKTTRSLLNKAGIAPIGDPRTQSKDTVAEFQGEGMRLFIIGVHAFAPMGSVPALIKEIKKESSDRVIIFPHWGSEYQLRHNKTQETLAKTWIDAGADAIIGAHPHVIQDIGVYRGVPIVYSLGNFIFDQTFSKNTQQGLVVAGEFTTSGLSLILLPHESKRYQPHLLRGQEKRAILNRITVDVTDFIQTTDMGPVLFFPAP